MLTMFKTLLFIVALQGIAIAIFRWSLKPFWQKLVGPVEVALLLLIPVVGLFGQNVFVFYGFMMFSALTALGSAEKLAVRYLLLLVCFPPLRTTLMVGSFYLADVDAIDFFALGALVVLIGLGRKQASAVPVLSLAAGAMFLSCLLLTVRGMPVGGVLREIPSTFLRVLVPFWITAKAIRNHAGATDAALAIVWGGMGNAVIAMFEAVRHWLLYQSFYVQLHAKEALGVSATTSVRAGMLRAHGMVFNYEGLGLLTAMALLTATAYRSRFSVAGFWAVAVTLAGGCLASQARGGWLVAIVGLVALAVYERRWTMLGSVAAAAVPFLLVIAALGSSHARFAEFIGKSGHASQTLDYRSRLLSRGIEEVRASPWTGQTRDQLDDSMQDLRQGQNIIDFVNVHLNIALIGGLPLLAVWLLAFFTPVYMSWRARPRRAPTDSAPPLGLPLGLVLGSIVFVAGTSLTDRIPSLVMIGFGLTSCFLRLNAAPVGAGRRASSEVQVRKPLVHPLLV